MNAPLPSLRYSITKRSDDIYDIWDNVSQELAQGNLSWDEANEMCAILEALPEREAKRELFDDDYCHADDFGKLLRMLK